MASTNPTINGKTLSVAGTKTNWDPPAPRISFSRAPSVDGVFPKRHGHEGPFLRGSGVLRGATEAILNAAIRTIQNATNHAPSEYVDGDGSTHANCILLSYSRRGEVLNKESNGAWWADISWQLVKLVAT